MSEELKTAAKSKSCIKRFEKVELNSCVIKSKEDFYIPERNVSSIEKLDLEIKFELKAKYYKKTFAKNRFVNVIEAKLTFGYSNEEEESEESEDEDEDEEEEEEDDEQTNVLAVAMIKSIPNVKKLEIGSHGDVNLKTLKAITQHCKQVEFLTFQTEENELFDEKNFIIAIPYICKHLQNLQFIHFNGCGIIWQQARTLLLHCQQLQAILNYGSLFVRATAKMSDVSRFLKETIISDWERLAADKAEGADKFGLSSLSNFKTIPIGFWDIRFF